MYFNCCLSVFFVCMIDDVERIQYDTCWPLRWHLLYYEYILISCLIVII